MNEALCRFEEPRKRGARLIDVGCMQIDHHFHSSRFRSLAATFDPHEDQEDHQYGGERFGAWTANPRILQSTDALTATGSSAVMQPKAVVIARENNFNEKFQLIFNHKLLIVNE